jgi:hypothetical protein
MKRSTLLLTLILLAKTFYSQEWIELWKTEKNFYTIQQAFHEHWKDKDVSVKGHGYKQFRRWEEMMEPRVYPSGDITLPTRTWEIYEEYLKNDPRTGSKSMLASTTWTAVGPFGPLNGLAVNNLPRKAGRYNFVTFHPSIATTFWCGSPSGGLWKTTNNGASWTTNTDNLATMGMADLAIDPTNTNRMYLATGDGYSLPAFTNGLGVLTSTDAGITWTTTGLTWPPSSGFVMRKLIIDPGNPNKLVAATNNGIYTSADAAATWTQINTSNVFDCEFNTVNSNTVYASGAGFSVSINGGLTFSLVNTGIPPSGRMAIGVSPANGNYVYVLSSTGNGVLSGFYRSINAGQSFSLMMNSPNILSADCAAQGTDGQGWYDLACAVSPTNINEVTIGGINIWQSLNGGNNFTNIGCAYGTGSPPFIHADHQDVEYTTAGVLYSANDGGICRYTGGQWSDITGIANIAHIYRIGCSGLSPNLWVSGHQDNGSNIYDQGNYKASLWGDGMDCFMDRTNDQNMFATQFNGTMWFTGNAGLSWATCTAGASGQSGFVTPWKQDPQNSTTFYCGRNQMKKSTGNIPPLWFTPQGLMSPVTATQNITEFAIAPSNNQIIYAIHGTSGVFRSIDAGATWTISNSGLPAGLAKTYVAVHPTNPNIAWVTCSGYTMASKVYSTSTGGTSWQPMLSGGLPNLPVNCIVYEVGNPNDRLYIGMDIGVYYRDNITGTWVQYNLGLPNVVIKDLEISPAAPNKLRAATFGRGIYQVDLVPNAAPPVTAFNYVGNKCALTSTLIMNDNSSNAPTAWSWSVVPAAGVVINSPAVQNPTVTFTNFGTYTVSMVASNGFGAGSLNTQTVSIFSPTVSALTSTSLVCNGASFTGTASGANSYTWQPGNIYSPTASYTPAFTVNYTVTGVAPNGCTSWDTVTVFWDPCVVGMFQVGNELVKYRVYPNPAKDNLFIHIGVSQEAEFEIQLIDAEGKIVSREEMIFSKDKQDLMLNTAAISQGLYLVNIKPLNGGVQTVKVMKDW